MNKSRINLLKQWARNSTYSYIELKNLYKELYLQGNKEKFKELMNSRKIK